MSANAQGNLVLVLIGRKCPKVSHITAVSSITHVFLTPLLYKLAISLVDMSLCKVFYAAFNNLFSYITAFPG